MLRALGHLLRLWCASTRDGNLRDAFSDFRCPPLVAEARQGVPLPSRELNPEHQREISRFACRDGADNERIKSFHENPLLNSRALLACPSESVNALTYKHSLDETPHRCWTCQIANPGGNEQLNRTLLRRHFCCGRGTCLRAIDTRTGHGIGRNAGRGAFGGCVRRRPISARSASSSPARARSFRQERC